MSLLCLYFVLPFRVPLGLVTVVDGILLGLLLKGYWRRWAELLLLLVLWLGQTAVLIAWGARITASDAFRSVPQRSLIGPWNPAGLVIDSAFQEAFMTVFWCAAGGIVGVVALASLVRVGIALLRRRKWQRGTSWRVLAMLVAVFVLVRMLGDTREFHRVGASLADSVSPDGELQVRLVPIDAFSDLNGVVMFREAGSLWWYPMNTVGDQLTVSGDDVAFVWDSDTQVRLLVGGEPCGTYDLQIGLDVSRPAGGPSPAATHPVASSAPANQASGGLPLDRAR